MKRRQALAGIAGLATLAGCTENEEPTTQPDRSITLTTDTAEVTIDEWDNQIAFATPTSVSSGVTHLWLTHFEDPGNTFGSDSSDYFWDGQELADKREVDELYPDDKLVLRSHTEDETQTDIQTVPAEGEQ